MPSGCILLHGVRSGPRRVFDIMMGSDPGAEHLHIITCTVSVEAATAEATRAFAHALRVVIGWCDGIPEEANRCASGSVSSCGRRSWRS